MVGKKIKFRSDLFSLKVEILRQDLKQQGGPSPEKLKASEYSHTLTRVGINSIVKSYLAIVRIA